MQWRHGTAATRGASLVTPKRKQLLRELDGQHIIRSTGEPNGHERRGGTVIEDITEGSRVDREAEFLKTKSVSRLIFALAPGFVLIPGILGNNDEWLLGMLYANRGPDPAHGGPDLPPRSRGVFRADQGPD